MENLGGAFIDGKLINLETTELEELNDYLQKVRVKKQEQKKKLNHFLDKIYN